MYNDEHSQKSYISLINRSPYITHTHLLILFKAKKEATLNMFKYHLARVTQEGSAI